MICICNVMISIPKLCAMWKHGLTTLCWTMKSLSHTTVFEFRCVGVLLYIRDDLSYNVTSTDPEDLENLGFILYNGDSNRVCLYALYSPHSTTHQMSLYDWFLCHIWESAKRYIVSVPCQVIILGLCNNYVWVIILPHMRICRKAVSVLVRQEFINHKACYSPLGQVIQTKCTVYIDRAKAS